MITKFYSTQVHFYYIILSSRTVVLKVFEATERHNHYFFPGPARSLYFSRTTNNKSTIETWKPEHKVWNIIGFAAKIAKPNGIAFTASN